MRKCRNFLQKRNNHQSKICWQTIEAKIACNWNSTSTDFLKCVLCLYAISYVKQDRNTLADGSNTSVWHFGSLSSIIMLIISSEYWRKSLVTLLTMDHCSQIFQSTVVRSFFIISDSKYYLYRKLLLRVKFYVKTLQGFFFHLT